MKRLFWLGAVCVLGGTGCNRGDGGRLAHVGAKVAEKVHDLVPERGPFAGSLGLLPDANLESRVRYRFQTDRYLAPLPIEISAELGSVRLKGQVDSDVLKRRAVEIAESTVGVDKVLDELAVVR